jgi:hypothetical protein
MATEKLKFKLELYATMWDRPPHVEILINDHNGIYGRMFKKDITGTEDKPDIVEFEYEMTEGQEYNLLIKRSGKQGKSKLANPDTDNGVLWPEQIEYQTVTDEDGNIIKDQVLHLKSIEIDEITIGSLVYEGVYTPKYPEPWATLQRESGVELPESFKNVTELGHEGQWKFTFGSPFYMWLLENLY